MPQDPASSPHRRRLKRIEGRGHARYLTFSCFQRRPFLASDRTRNWLVQAIAMARRKHGFHLWAWVLMPEHVHLLIWPGPRGSDSAPQIGHALTTIKQSVSKTAIHWVKTQAPQHLPKMIDLAPNGKRVVRFWQRGGGYDRNMFSAGKIWDVIRYIHSNPVERGLCAHQLDWPWSSAIEFARPGEGLLPIDRHSIPAEPPTDRSYS